LTGYTTIFNIVGFPKIIDIIVAAMALNRNMKLVTSDKHFAVIRKIRQDFKLYIYIE